MTSGATTDVTAGLRIQGQTGAGSVNLAMMNVPLSLTLKQVGNLTYYEIVSSVLIRVYSVSTNQEIPALRQVMVPPSSLASEQSLLDPAAHYDKVQPLRLRMDGVPVGVLRFEVFAMSNADGTGQVMGSGSTIAEIEPGVQPVTVTLLPHGYLPEGAVLPGIGNEPTNQNPPPRSRTALEAARRFWSGLRRR